MYCWNCGYVMRDIYKFCPKCGKKAYQEIERTEEIEISEEPEAKKENREVASNKNNIENSIEKNIEKYEIYLKEKKKSKQNTIESYMRDIKQFQEYLTNNMINYLDIKKNEVSLYLEYLEKNGKKEATRARNIATIKNFYSFLKMIGYDIDSNIIFMNSIKVNKQEVSEEDIKKEEQLKENMLKIDFADTPKGIRDKAIITLTYKVPIKPTEIISIKLNDFDKNIGELTIGTKLIKLDNETYNSIVNYIKNSREILCCSKEEKALFVNANGHSLTRQGYWKIIERYKENQNINLVVLNREKKENLRSNEKSVEIQKISHESYLFKTDEKKETIKSTKKDNVEVLKKILNIEISEYFKEDRFKIFRQIALDKGWQLIRDIDFEELKSEPKVTFLKYYYVCEHVKSRKTYETYMKEKNKVNISKFQEEQKEFVEYQNISKDEKDSEKTENKQANIKIRDEIKEIDIKQYFSGDRFEILRQVACNKGWKLIKDIDFEELRSIPEISYLKYYYIVNHLTNSRIYEKYIETHQELVEKTVKSYNELYIDEEIKELDIEEVFYESKFTVFRKISKINNWEKVKDIQFDKLMLEKGIGEGKYNEIINKLSNNQRSTIKRNAIMPLDGFLNLDIDEVFIENKFNVLRRIAVQNNWKKVKDIQFDELEKMQGMGKQKVYEINKIITNSNKLVDIIAKEQQKKVNEIENIIIDKTKEIHIQEDKFISIDEIKSVTSLNDEDIQEILNILREENKINCKDNGVRYNFKSIIEQIDNLKNERNKQILESRLEGKTYQEIGDSENPKLSRERVRQIIDKTYKKYITYAEESKYRGYYEKYDFDEETFCAYFNEKKSTYMFLEDNFKKGKENFESLVESENIEDDKLERINKLFKKVRIFGQTVHLDRMSILGVLVKEFAKEPTNISNFKEIIDPFFEQYNLQLYDSRTLENMLSRSKSIVMGMHHQIRYYDYKKLENAGFNELREILNVEDGCYSSKYFFDTYPQLMQEIDIRDEYELHNLLKTLKINSDRTAYLRMPNILIGYKNKEEFYAEKINEICPLKIEEFLAYLEKEYGHKPNSLYAYIKSEFKEYISDETIYSEYYALSEDELNKLKNTFEDRVYMINEIKSILSSLGITEKALNNVNMSKIDFAIRENYVMPIKYKSAEDYLRKEILKSRFIKIDECKINKMTYYNYLTNFVKEHLVIKIDDNEYANINFLKESGITKEKLEEFEKNIIETFDEEEYFSISNIKEKINVEIFEELGLEDCFYETQVGIIDSISKLKLDSNVLFCRKKSRKNLNRASFVEDIVEEFESIQLDNLKEYIEEKYSIQVSYEALRNIIYDSELYYNSILDKVYINRDVFYKEVYEEND